MMWTLIPYLLLLAIITVFQIRHSRRRSRMTKSCDSIYSSLSRSMNGLHIRTYGRPSTDLEKTFPEIATNK